MEHCLPFQEPGSTTERADLLVHGVLFLASLLLKTFTIIPYVVLLLALGQGIQRIQEKGDVAACLLLSKAVWHIQGANLRDNHLFKEEKASLKGLIYLCVGFTC